MSPVKLGRDIAPKPMGRPSKFTPQLIDSIILKMREGVPERAIFDAPDMPAWSQWCRYKQSQKDQEFHTRFVRAHLDGMKVWEEKCVKIAHDESRDLIPDGKGGFKSDNTAVNRDRLKIDTYRWLMSVLWPKVYGTKIETTGEVTVHTEYVDKPAQEPVTAWLERKALKPVKAPKNQLQ